MLTGALRWSSVIRKLAPEKEFPVIAPILSNCPEYASLILGTLARGSVISPVNFSYQIGRMYKMCTHAKI